MSCNDPNFRKAFKVPWLERELSFLSIGHIIVLFGPTESPQMSFEDDSIKILIIFKKYSIFLRVKQ